MFILAIDTSCDETSVAVTWNDIVLSNVISSQVELHKKYGGVVPMIAMRAHREKIDLVIKEALKRANAQLKKIISINNPPWPSATPPKEGTNLKSPLGRGVGVGELELEDINVFAVTYGPGLAPALEVGVEKAKELAKKYKKSLVAVDHMEGHIYANFAQKISAISNFQFLISKQKNNNSDSKAKPYTINPIPFPLLCLLISGGHTELVIMKNHGKYEIIGETLDDAVGEAFDKIAKLLNLGYPGGPIVEQLAREGDPFKYNFPIPLEKSKDCDFSYSGLKTSVLYTLQKVSPKGIYSKKQICGVCASFQRAAVEHLVQKTRFAVEKLLFPERRVTKSKDYLKNAFRQAQQVKYLLLGGGVVANKLVRSELRKAMKPYHIKVIYPTDKKLLGDNAAMIAVAGYYKTKRKEHVKNISMLDRMPGLRIES